jgi:Iron-containing redox enzyme
VLIPPPRGELSGWLTGALRSGDDAAAPPPPPPAARAWLDEDLQLALWCCYELHYRGFDDAAGDLEWSPPLLAFRAGLERRWLTGLRSLVGEAAAPAPAAVPRALRRLVSGWSGPDLSGYLLRQADRTQFTEFVTHRSVYQLKEADPHSFGIPRTDGAVKAALVEIQADEYGGGRPARMHAELFRATMRGLGLDDAYGRYVPAVPAVTLALSNLMSLFGLHRRWLPALLGHLAALEMTSTGPNRRYSGGARRLGLDATVREYFDEHVEADAVHEQLAAHDLAGGFAAAHPAATADLMFGASCCLALDDAFAEHLLGSWGAGRSSLR